MNPILDIAKTHFADAPMNFIDVPEWGESPDRPLRIWFKTRMTIRERDRIYNKPDGGSYTGFVAMARFVALMSRNERGERLFDEQDDLHALTHSVDQSIVWRIASKILAETGQLLTAQDQVDNQKKA